MSQPILQVLEIQESERVSVSERASEVRDERTSNNQVNKQEGSMRYLYNFFHFIGTVAKATYKTLAVVISAALSISLFTVFLIFLPAIYTSILFGVHVRWLFEQPVTSEGERSEPERVITTENSCRKMVHAYSRTPSNKCLYTIAELQKMVNNPRPHNEAI